MSKRVVIVGGGFAGATLARTLEKDFEVTLIDNKEYFEFTPSILRVLVEPEHLKKIQVLHKSYLKNARIVIGEVTNVTTSAAIINKKHIPFDYLALCSGSTYASPIKESKRVIPLRAKSLFAAAKDIKNAKTILIIGGGLVGVELVAEISEKYPQKKITLISTSPQIIERNHPRSRTYILNYLAKKNIQIRTGEKVIQHKGTTYITDLGTKVQADLAFFCTGITPSTSYLIKSPLQKNLLKNKIEVNSFLQLNTSPHIFSAGDVNTTAVEKTAQNAELQAKVIAKNIRALENNQPLHNYSAKSTPIIISLGKRKGVFESPPFVLTGFIPSIFKWFVEKKEMWKYR